MKSEAIRIFRVNNRDLRLSRWTIYVVITAAALAMAGLFIRAD